MDNFLINAVLDTATYFMRAVGVVVIIGCGLVIYAGVKDMLTTDYDN